MTGADLIKWIQENKAEKLEIYAQSDYCIYPVRRVTMVESEDSGKKYVVIDE